MNPPVIVPYTDLRVETLQSLCSAGMPWEAGQIDPTDPTAYWKLVSEWWAKGQTFVVVEQDIVIRQHTITNLLRCPNDWCAYPYPYLDTEYPGLGCMKFTGRLLERHPQALEQATERRYPKHEVDGPGQHWCVLDDAIRTVLQRRGETLHVHQPALGHVRDYEGSPHPSHDCHGPVPGGEQ